MSSLHPVRRLLRAKDVIDARHRDPLDVPALARTAHLSPAHFSREFRRTFGESPHQYLLTRRMERAAVLLRNTDRTVADICFTVGLSSVGSFTSSFGWIFGLSPTAYRAAQPPAIERARSDVRPPGVRPPAVQHVRRRQPRSTRIASPATVHETGGTRC